ncbi:hypothetical protein HaLaN_26678 [Haematococcus lacustris]|uniref:Uncharacterized protein n=1 Tax=Haematococcus lacustris TaxID=44745 RepID=A0A6A0A6U8_HAELA|nr:hypothetical protein HaLaN_26678 [Haematococcus lacustris]
MSDGGHEQHQLTPELHGRGQAAVGKVKLCDALAQWRQCQDKRHSHIHVEHEHSSPAAMLQRLQHSHQLLQLHLWATQPQGLDPHWHLASLRQPVSSSRCQLQGASARELRSFWQELNWMLVWQKGLVFTSHFLGQQSELLEPGRMEQVVQGGCPWLREWHSRGVTGRSSSGSCPSSVEQVWGCSSESCKG